MFTCWWWLSVKIFHTYRARRRLLAVIDLQQKEMVIIDHVQGREIHPKAYLDSNRYQELRARAIRSHTTYGLVVAATASACIYSFGWTVHNWLKLPSHVRRPGVIALEIFAFLLMMLDGMVSFLEHKRRVSTSKFSDVLLIEGSAQIHDVPHPAESKRDALRESANDARWGVPPDDDDRERLGRQQAGRGLVPPPLVDRGVPQPPSSTSTGQAPALGGGDSSIVAGGANGVVVPASERERTQGERGADRARRDAEAARGSQAGSLAAAAAAAAAATTSTTAVAERAGVPSTSAVVGEDGPITSGSPRWTNMNWRERDLHVKELDNRLRSHAINIELGIDINEWMELRVGSGFQQYLAAGEPDPNNAETMSMEESRALQDRLLDTFNQHLATKAPRSSAASSAEAPGPSTVTPTNIQRPLASASASASDPPVGQSAPAAAVPSGSTMPSVLNETEQAQSYASEEQSWADLSWRARHRYLIKLDHMLTEVLGDEAKRKFNQSTPAIGKYRPTAKARDARTLTHQAAARTFDTQDELLNAYNERLNQEASRMSNVEELGSSASRSERAVRFPESSKRKGSPDRTASPSDAGGPSGTITAAAAKAALGGASSNASTSSRDKPAQSI